MRLRLVNEGATDPLSNFHRSWGNDRDVHSEGLSLALAYFIIKSRNRYLFDFLQVHLDAARKNRDCVHQSGNILDICAYKSKSGVVL